MELQTLMQLRFEHHRHRHANFTWEMIASQLTKQQWETIHYMETSGGEPDIVVVMGRLIVVDMSKETPVERRNCCYDQQAREGRKKFPPTTSAWEDALKHGLKLIDEPMYLAINAIEPLDLKTSSWLDTPVSIRLKGGALTGDTRFGRTFIYHNGADSYYSVRAYRGYFELTL